MNAKLIAPIAIMLTVGCYQPSATYRPDYDYDSGQAHTQQTSPASREDGGWETYTLDGGRFQIQFQTQPQMLTIPSSTEFGSSEQPMFVSEVREVAYGVSWIEVPPYARVAGYEGAVEATANEGQLLAYEPTEVGGQPATLVRTAKRRDGAIWISDMLICLVSDRVYFLMVMYEDGAPAETGRFMTSFQPYV